jgi:hypothetical protein
MIFQNLVGQKFNKLTVIEYIGKVPSGQSKWRCACDCGNQHDAVGSHLKTGNIKSCGCLISSENRKNRATRHGGTKTPEWTSYHAAKKRCNPKHVEKYPDYAGRGIQFKFKNFEQFLEHIGPRPEPKFDYSLERINNDGNYEIGNVKWSTKLQQARNRRCDNCEKLKLEIDKLKALIAQFQGE